MAPGSPAEGTGLRAEDLIVAVGGEPVETVTELQRLMVAELIGSAVSLSLIRQGRPLDVELVPEELTT